MPAPKPLDSSVHHLVRKLFKQMQLREMNTVVVGQLAGISGQAIRSWKSGDKSPSLSQIEAALNAVGLELIARHRYEKRLCECGAPAEHEGTCLKN